MIRIKTKRKEFTAIGIVLCAVALSNLTFAQDDIEEPAGDLAEAQEDGEGNETGGGDPMSTDPTYEMSADPGETVESSPEAAGKNKKTKSASADGESSQRGPVWDSYNSNLKSVAEEVTKGIRVEDVVEPPSEYHYAAFGKPDPFVPPMVAKRLSDIASVSGLEVPIISPLQRYDVNQLRVVGIWQLSTGERKALVLTPNNDAAGQGIIVRSGDAVGKRGGKVLAIGDIFLTVREFRLAADGTRQYEDIQMMMGDRDPNKVPGKLKFIPGAEDSQIILEGQRSGPSAGVQSLFPSGAAGISAVGAGASGASGRTVGSNADQSNKAGASAPNAALSGAPAPGLPAPGAASPIPAGVPAAVAPAPALPGSAPQAQNGTRYIPGPGQPMPGTVPAGVPASLPQGF